MVVPRRPRCRTSPCGGGGGGGESGPVGSASENITASRLSAVALFSGVTSATVDWNRDQFCENSTTLFTVSESGVY